MSDVVTPVKTRKPRAKKVVAPSNKEKIVSFLKTFGLRVVQNIPVFGVGFALGAFFL